MPLPLFPSLSPSLSASTSSCHLQPVNLTWLFSRFPPIAVICSPFDFFVFCWFVCLVCIPLDCIMQTHSLVRLSNLCFCLPLCLSFCLSVAPYLSVCRSVCYCKERSELRQTNRQTEKRWRSRSIAYYIIALLYLVLFACLFVIHCIACKSLNSTIP